VAQVCRAACNLVCRMPAVFSVSRPVPVANFLGAYDYGCWGPKPLLETASEEEHCSHGLESSARRGDRQLFKGAAMSWACEVDSRIPRAVGSNASTGIRFTAVMARACHL
jgi:hypothetical protein